MNLKDNIIIINDVDKTFQIESIRLDGQKYAIKFNNSDKVYSYAEDRVIWLNNPYPE